MGLRDIGATLPPGFRFYPSDEELVCHYLLKKISKQEALKGTLVEIDLHTCEPWQLPEVAKLNTTEWYFFSFRDRKYATGFRTNRATKAGYWKATGKDRVILDPASRDIVGMRKTLVFYKNRAPNGIKTGWIMHEFRLESPHMPPKEDWVLCRVFHKNKAEENNNNHCQHMHDHNIASTSSPQHICHTCHQANNNPFTSHNNNNNPTLLPQQDPIIIPNNNIANNDPNIITTTGTTNANIPVPSTLNASNSLLNLINSSFSWSDFLNSSIKNDDDDDFGGLMWDMDLDEVNQSNTKLGDQGGLQHVVPPNCLPPLEIGGGDDEHVRFGQDDCGTALF